MIPRFFVCVAKVGIIFELASVSAKKSQKNDVKVLGRGYVGGKIGLKLVLFCGFMPNFLSLRKRHKCRYSFLMESMQRKIQ